MLAPPHHPLNFFELLGLPTQYPIDMLLLTQNYYARQRLAHPDRATPARHFVAQYQASQNYSATLNKAYSVLKNPMERAIHLFEINHISWETDINLSAAVMWHYMERHEEIQRDIEQHNNKNIMQKMAICEKEYQTHITIITSAFAENNWPQAKEAVQKLKMIARLLDEIKKASKIINQYHTKNPPSSV